MHLPPFLFETVAVAFIILGLLLGWFLRTKIVILALAVFLVVFLGLVIATFIYEYDSEYLPWDMVQLSAMFSLYCAAMSLVGAIPARLIRNWRRT